MENSENLTIEQLATLLNGKLWDKGEIKRVYLPTIGYTTKKMETTTYIFIDENNNIQISCYVKCPSQPYAWIQSQRDEFIGHVENRLQNLFDELKSERLENENVREI